MKVIEDNYSYGKFPIRIQCEHCGSIIEIEDEDELSQTEVCDPNEYFWTCPCCERCNIIQIDLTD